MCSQGRRRGAGAVPAVRRAWLRHVRHLGFLLMERGAATTSKLHSSCVLEADGSGSSVGDSIHWEVGPPT